MLVHEYSEASHPIFSERRTAWCVHNHGFASDRLRRLECSEAFIRRADPLPQCAVRLYVFAADQLAGVLGADPTMGRPRLFGCRGRSGGDQAWPGDCPPPSAVEGERPLSGHSYSSVYAEPMGGPPPWQ